MEDLGTLGGAASFAWSANTAGLVVGQSYRADGKAHGFVFAGGTMNDIGTLGGTLSNATAVNASGLVVGAATNSAGRWHANRLPAGSATLVDLGTLGGNWSGAEGVNGDGAIVGWSQTSTGVLHACLWTEADGLVDLNGFVDPASGWVLSTAYGINDKGQITGYGFLDGQVRAFRLSPAVPVDNMPPVVTGVSATPDVLDPPNHRLVPVAVSVTATDDSGDAPACVVSDVRSNEPDNGLGDGDTAVDIVRIGPLSLLLRAERSASGTGRIYTISVLCTDDAGNATPGAVTVTVGKGSTGTDTVVKRPKAR
jgi:probable HAF family extracellular repeat protein